MQYCPSYHGSHGRAAPMTLSCPIVDLINVTKNFSKSRHSWHLTEHTMFMNAIIQRCVTSCPGGDQRLQGQVGIKFIKKRMGPIVSTHLQMTRALFLAPF